MPAKFTPLALLMECVRSNLRELREEHPLQWSDITANIRAGTRSQHRLWEFERGHGQVRDVDAVVAAYAAAADVAAEELWGRIVRDWLEAIEFVEDGV